MFSGGGNSENIDLVKFGPALRWMLYEAMEHGLRIERFQGGWGPPGHTPSMTPVWWLLEILPLRRLSYAGTRRDSTRRWWDRFVHFWHDCHRLTRPCRQPHWFAGRVIQPGQMIHESAIEYLESGNSKASKVKARIRDGNHWVPVNELREEKLRAVIPVEKDSYASTLPRILSKLEDAVSGNALPSKEWVDLLLQLLRSCKRLQIVLWNACMSLIN